MKARLSALLITATAVLAMLALALLSTSSPNGESAFAADQHPSPGKRAPILAAPGQVEPRASRKAVTLTEDLVPADGAEARPLRFETCASVPPPEGTRARWKGDTGDGCALDPDGVALLPAARTDEARIQLLGPRVLATEGCQIDRTADLSEVIETLDFKGWDATHRMTKELWELRGTVVGPDGKALGGGEIHLEAERLPSLGKHDLHLADGGRFGIRCWVPLRSLTDVSVLRLLRQGKGSSVLTEWRATVAPEFFRRPIRGLAELGTIELRVPAEEEVPKAATDSAMGSIWASIDAPDSIDRAQLHLRAIGPGTPPGGVPFEWSKKSAWAKGLKPGTYEVTLWVGDQVIFRAGGVLVLANEVAKDTRLTPIAPGSALNMIRITPTYSPGVKPSSSPRLHVLGPDGWVKVVAIDHKPMHTFLVAVRDTVDLRLSAKDCRTVYAPGVSSDRTIELGPGIPVEVQIHDLPTFHGNAQWQLVLTHRVSGLSLKGNLDGTRATFVVGEAGTYDAQLRFARHGNWYFRRQGATIGAVEVGKSPVSTRLTVPANFMEESR